LEPLRAPAASVEYHRHPPLPDEPADLGEEGRQHLDQAGIGLGGQHEERLTSDVIGPVVGGGRHADAHSGEMRLRQSVLAVVRAPVDVEEAERGTARGDAALGQSPAEVGGARRIGAIGAGRIGHRTGASGQVWVRTPLAALSARSRTCAP
jgi:hypothetical protein